MKIAISTDSGMVSPHFGRAPEFTFIEIENNKLIGKKIVSNPGHSTGSIPRFINEQGAEYMITGGMGRRAIQFFRDYGIDIIVGVTGKVDDVIKKILDGTLEGGESLCNPRGGKGYGIDKVHTKDDEGHHLHPF